MPTKKSSVKIDIHTQSAIKVASADYFVISQMSGNENPGLLVGTEVKKLQEPTPRESRIWKNQMYWSVLVECPNSETRRIGCDTLISRTDGKPFAKQQKMFSQLTMS